MGYRRDERNCGSIYELEMKSVRFCLLVSFGYFINFSEGNLVSVITIEISVSVKLERRVVTSACRWEFFVETRISEEILETDYVFVCEEISLCIFGIWIRYDRYFRRDIQLNIFD